MDINIIMNIVMIQIGRYMSIIHNNTSNVDIDKKISLCSIDGKFCIL